MIFVDADGCPVKDEVCRVAERHGLEVKLVSNTWMRVPSVAWLELVVVGDGFDAADDWIVEQAAERDVVVTADIPLAARCLMFLGHNTYPHPILDLTARACGDSLRACSWW